MRAIFLYLVLYMNNEHEQLLQALRALDRAIKAVVCFQDDRYRAQCSPVPPAPGERVLTGFGLARWVRCLFARSAHKALHDQEQQRSYEQACGALVEQLGLSVALFRAYLTFYVEETLGVSSSFEGALSTLCDAGLASDDERQQVRAMVKLCNAIAPAPSAETIEQIVADALGYHRLMSGLAKRLQ